MSRSVGIEILKNRVKLLIAETGGKKPKIVGFVEQPITCAPDEEWEGPAAAAIKEAFAYAKVSKGRVVASLDSGDAIIRELSLPFKDPDQLRLIVPHEIESAIHNYEIEDLVVDFFKTGESENGSMLLAAAVPKKAVKERLSVLEKGGVDPIALDLDVAALFNTLNSTGAIDTDEPFLILHGTPRFSKLIFVEEKKPKSMRTIRFSMPSPEQEKQNQEEHEAAREWKTEEVPGPVPIVLIENAEAAKFSELDFETRSSLIEILAKEVSRFLLANAADASPSHMLVTGEFEDEETAALLESATTIPTRIFPLLDNVEHFFRPDEDDVGARIAVPLGLALKGAGIDALGMDFRKGEFAYRKKYEAVKTTALVTIELVIVFLAALALYFHFQTRDIKEVFLAKVYDEQSRFYEALFNNEKPSSPDRTFVEMMERKRKLQEAVGEAVDYPMKQTALDIAGKLYRALENFQRKFANARLGGDELWVEFDRVEITQNVNPDRKYLTIRLVGRFINNDYGNGLLEEIRKVDWFKNAEWKGIIKKDKNKGFRFTLEATTAENR